MDVSENNIGYISLLTNIFIKTILVMILHPTSKVPIISYTKVRENVSWFIDFLEEENIDISSNKFMSSSLEYALQLENWSRSKDDNLKDYKLNSILSESIGISYIISIIKKASTYKSFENIKRLFKNFSTADPIFYKKGISKQERNFLFELEIACLFLCCGYEVFSKSEPDVIVKDQSTWDISCKMIYSDNPVSMARTIDKGIEQCLNFNSNYGLVIAGLSNITNHNSFLPMLDEKEDIWGSYPNIQSAMKKMEDYFKNCFQHITEQSLNHFGIGRDNTKFRGILLITHTICSVNAVPMTLSQIGLVRRKDLYGIDIEGPELTFCNGLNHIAQTVFTV